MNRIEILGHTADVRLQITADTLGDLFAAGLSGMNEMLRKDFCRRNAPLTLVRELSIKSPDLTALLIDFLSEVLTLTYMEKALFCHVEIKRLEDGYLAASVEGRPVDRLDEDIKAVTYHEAEVKYNEDSQWQTMIIFDI